MNNEINEKLKTLPDKSGVYLMKDASGNIIYVGKAKNLKNRVRSYFKSHTHPPKVSSMLSNVETFEYIITDSELEALILENNLIKENMPKYNILLKDDKTYPFLKITANEMYPRILLTRKVIRDGSLYFGPYQSASELKQLIALVNDIFSLRRCKTEFYPGFSKKRPCLFYQLGQCKGVCSESISADEYKKLIDGAIDFINGNTADVKNALLSQMKEASDSLDFEKAAILRDRLNAIESLSQRQKIVNPTGDDIDAVAMYNADDVACVQIFFIRCGRIIGKEHYFIKNTEDSDGAQILAEFLRMYYEDCSFIPSRILLEYELEEKTLMEEYISLKAGRSVHIATPKIGKNASLIRMISANAKKEHSERKLKIYRDIEFKDRALTELTELLDMDKPPMNIEAYDISNMGRDTSVASMVVYKNGKPDTRRYRNFRMKNVSGQDDYASMQEAVQRRINRALQEIEKIKSGELSQEKALFLPLPDVIFADGGKGHQKAVAQITMEYNIPVFGIVKDEEHRTRGLVGEHGEIAIDRGSDAFMLLKAIQDEMHRRAITQMRANQSKKLLVSCLDHIAGVGDKRKKSLLSHFKSLARIKNASVEELMCVKGIDKKTAENIYLYFRENEKQ